MPGDLASPLMGMFSMPYFQAGLKPVGHIVYASVDTELAKGLRVAIVLSP